MQKYDHIQLPALVINKIPEHHSAIKHIVIRLLLFLFVSLSCEEINKVLTRAIECKQYRLACDSFYDQATNIFCGLHFFDNKFAKDIFPLHFLYFAINVIVMNFSEGIQPDFFICRRDAIEIEIYFIRSKKVIMTNSSINH